MPFRNPLESRVMWRYGDSPRTSNSVRTSAAPVEDASFGRGRSAGDRGRVEPTRVRRRHRPSASGRWRHSASGGRAGAIIRIDAPESRQSCTLSGVGWPCGQNATHVLTGVVNGRVVTCRGDKRDRYGRLIAVCYLGTDDLNARMVRDGWALAYRRYAPDYVPQETEARASGSGIWQGQFLEPWEWRRQRRAETGAAR